MDGNDNILGTCFKSEANQDPKLIHREVGGVLYDRKNRVLLQQRSFKKTVNPGLWTNSWAGHVTHGSTPEETAHRELKEELGFDTVLKFVRKDKEEQPNETHFNYIYLGPYNNQPIVIDQSEVAQTRFLSKDDFEKALKTGEITMNFSLIKIKEFWDGKFDSQKIRRQSPR